jgi:hypothetical protein
MLLRRVRLAAFVLSLGLLTTRTSPSQDVQGGPLQLTLTQVQDSSRLRFRVELHNRSDQPLILFLGWNQPYEIRLLLTDAHGRTLPLELKGPPLMASPMKPFIVTLHAERTFALPIDLADYWSREQQVRKLSLAPGQYTLSAEYRGHNRDDDLMPAPGQSPMKEFSPVHVWIGSVKSNALPFTLTQ